MFPLQPLLLPPKLVLRALDDLHTLAQVASTLPAVELRLTERIDALEARAAEAVQAVNLLIERADDLERALQAVEGINASAATLAQAAEPLQNAAERLGRVAERVPQGLFARRRPDDEA